MKTVTVLGAGLVTKPMVDYFIDTCGYQVIMATRTISKAEKIIAGRNSGRAVAWTTDQLDLLDQIVDEADLVVSMIPPYLHIPVAQSCLKNRTNMVTTSFISPEMAALDEKAQKEDIIILNEIGEDPGIDHMSTKRIIDDVKSEGGRVIEVTSYGAGLPAFEYNRNPFGYKFSWSPKGVMLAARTPGAYLVKGKRVDVPGDELFDNHWLVDVEGLGTFETYPNRDATRYVSYYGLDDDVSLFRGVFRFTGWCNTMRNLIKIGLLNDDTTEDFENKTYAEFTASLVGSLTIAKIESEVADFLGLELIDDFIKRLKWLGIFNSEKISILKGTAVDLLVDLMLKKMSYSPEERDMTIVHDEVIAEFEGYKEKRISTMVLEGIPHGDSAMSRAVSFPSAIASRLILEGKIRSKGIQMPTLPEIYKPVLEELDSLGLKFTHKTIRL